MSDRRNEKPVTLQVSEPEFHTILAALRYFQEHGQTSPVHRSEWIDDVATNGGEEIPLSAEAIDELCQTINCESG